jgi:hypothetical protein
VLSTSATGIHPATTRLVFPKPLSEVLGNSSSYTFGPGFIQFNGATWLDSRTFLANITRVRAAVFVINTVKTGFGRSTEGVSSYPYRFWLHSVQRRQLARQ